MPNDGTQAALSNQDQYKEIEEFIALLKESQKSMSMLQGAELDGVIIRLNNELIAMDKDLLAQNNAEYAALTADIKGAKSEFDALDEEIKKIIKSAETAAQVFDGLTKLAGFLTRVAV